MHKSKPRVHQWNCHTCNPLKAPERGNGSQIKETKYEEIDKILRHYFPTPVQRWLPQDIKKYQRAEAERRRADEQSLKLLKEKRKPCHDLEEQQRRLWERLEKLDKAVKKLKETPLRKGGIKPLAPAAPIAPA